MKTQLLTLAASFALITSLQANAGTSEVTWQNPEKFRDVKAGENQSKAKYRERVFYNLEKHFAKMSEKLPEGQTLKVNVTDLDLAGDVNAGGIERIRVIKDLYFPRIKFDYQLTDGTGSELKSGGINLKDMNFMMGSNLKYRSKAFGYEKKMLDEWFAETFAPEVASN